MFNTLSYCTARKSVIAPGCNRLSCATLAQSLWLDIYSNTFKRNTCKTDMLSQIAHVNLIKLLLVT